MSNPMAKYVAAAGLVGALAFGGYTVAGAQDSGSTTTQPGATTEAPTAPGYPGQGQAPDGARPEGGQRGDMEGGCDHDKDGGSTSSGETPSETPAPSSSSGTSSSNTQST